MVVLFIQRESTYYNNKKIDERFKFLYDLAVSTFMWYPSWVLSSSLEDSCHQNLLRKSFCLNSYFFSPSPHPLSRASGLHVWRVLGFSHITHLTHPNLVHVIQGLFYLLLINFRLDASTISNNIRYNTNCGGLFRRELSTRKYCRMP